MSAAATATAPSTEPSRVGRLLNLVRALIEYGKELATSLRQPSPTTDLPATRRAFGTTDIALILARITRGLQRAAALEARLVSNTTCLDAAPRRATAADATVASSRQRAEPADRVLAQLPAAEQIAAEVRRRPIGVVIADICRDLGILPSHPLWRELRLLIIRHGGSLARLVNDILDRMLPLPGPSATPAGTPAPSAPPSPACTGPP